MALTFLNNPPLNFRRLHDILVLDKSHGEPLISRDQADLLDNTPGLWQTFNQERFRLATEDNLADDIYWGVYISPDLRKRLHDIQNKAMYLTLMKHPSSRLQRLPHVPSRNIASFFKSRAGLHENDPEDDPVRIAVPPARPASAGGEGLHVACRESSRPASRRTSSRQEGGGSRSYLKANRSRQKDKIVSCITAGALLLRRANNCQLKKISPVTEGFCGHAPLQAHAVLKELLDQHRCKRHLAQMR